MIHLLLIPSCLTFLPDFWQSGAKSYIAVKCYILFLESWQRELATSFFAVFRNTLVHPKHPLLNEVLHMTCHSSESVNLYGSCNWKESQKWLIDLSPCTVLCFRHKLGCFSCIYYKFTCSSLILSSCSFNQKLFNMTLIWHLLVFKFIYKKKKKNWLPTQGHISTNASVLRAICCSGTLQIQKNPTFFFVLLICLYTGPPKILDITKRNNSALPV